MSHPVQHSSYELHLAARQMRGELTAALCKLAARTMASLARQFARALKARRDARFLSEMNDHMLRDIGTTRSFAEEARLFRPWD
jgi:uncharacterized protein YjiS (DUF1127 family)